MKNLFDRIFVFLIALALSGCSTIANSVISGQAPTVSWDTAKKAEDAFFKHEDYMEFPTEPLKDEKSLEYVRGLNEKLAKYAGDRYLSNLVLLKTARVQGISYLMYNEIDISRGMLNSMQNEAELACLVGHEIGHNALNHFERRNKKNPLGMALSKGLEYVKSNQELLYQLQQEQNEIFQSGWSKELEIEADKYGADLAAKAGYDPYAFCDLFERLSKKVVDNEIYRLKKFKGTHPALVDRVAILGKYLESKGYKPGQGVKNRESFLEGMSGIADIRTGEKPKSILSLLEKQNQFGSGLCSLAFPNKDLFMEEIIYQDDPTWSLNNTNDPQRIQNAINESLKNVPDWHNQHGKYICNFFICDVDARLGYNEFIHSDGTPFTANEIYDYVSKSPDWGNTKDPAVAQDKANSGHFEIGGSEDPAPSKSGHTVAVDPFGDLQDSGHAGGKVPEVYDANCPDPNTPDSAGESWQYNDGPKGGPNTPTWFYRKR